MADRRLPIYILVDVSGSMDGEPIQAVNSGIQQLVADLRNDPSLLDMAWLSVITFGDKAQQVVPLTDLEYFQMPELTAGGCTALGPALSLLCECRRREVQQPVSDKSKGDYRPLIFCFTDGMQNVGDFEQGIHDFSSMKWAGHAFVAIGPDADVAGLDRIAPGHALRLEDSSYETITKGFFGLCRLTILNPSHDWETIKTEWIDSLKD